MPLFSSLFLSFLSSLLTNLTSLVLSFDILFVVTVQSVPEGEKVHVFSPKPAEEISNVEIL